MKRRVHLRVEGLVQGVCYRASARDHAARLGLSGWVRNRSDGAVEAVAEGDAASVALFVAWCERGPPMARVERVEVRDQEPEGLSGGFHVTCGE